jgi:hypothetical protein
MLDTNRGVRRATAAVFRRNRLKPVGEPYDSTVAYIEAHYSIWLTEGACSGASDWSTMWSWTFASMSGVLRVLVRVVWWMGKDVGFR